MANSKDHSWLHVMGLTALVLTLTAQEARSEVLASGNNFSLAVKDDGTVWSWGTNNYDDLVYPDPSFGGFTFVVEPIPTQIPGLSGIVAVAADFYSAAALDNQGRVWWWGNTQQQTPRLITDPQFQ